MSERTKQVQFRMPEETHRALKTALAYDGLSFTDLFNKAAADYLAKRKAKTQQNAAEGDNARRG